MTIFSHFSTEVEVEGNLFMWSIGFSCVRKWRATKKYNSCSHPNSEGTLAGSTQKLVRYGRYFGINYHLSPSYYHLSLNHDRFYRGIGLCYSFFVAQKSATTAPAQRPCVCPCCTFKSGGKTQERRRNFELKTNTQPPKISRLFSAQMSVVLWTSVFAAFISVDNNVSAILSIALIENVLNFWLDDKYQLVSNWVPGHFINLLAILSTT